VAAASPTIVAASFEYISARALGHSGLLIDYYIEQSSYNKGIFFLQAAPELLHYFPYSS
jgi:hypothetical protein